jgi:hypothetical protein
MRRFNPFMLSAAFVLMGSGVAAAQGLVINPYPGGQPEAVAESETQAKKPQAAPLPVPVAKTDELSPAEKTEHKADAEPLSVSASELMELDPDIVTEPLGKPVSKKALSTLLEEGPEALPPSQQPDPFVAAESEPLPLIDDVKAAPASLPGAETPLLSVSQPDIPVAGQAQQAPGPLPMRPGLVYIRDGQILSAAAAKAPIQEPEQTLQAQAQWQAGSGEDVRAVLERWSQKAGVHFIWESPKAFVTQSELSGAGAYEDAVQALLDQHSDQAERPVAQLYQNPQLPQRVLVVRLSPKS